MRQVILGGGRPWIRLFIFVLLAMLALGGLGAYLFLGLFEETGHGSSEQFDTPAVEQAPEETVEEEDKEVAAAPTDPTLYLTVPRLGLYDHTVRTVRNDRAENALSLGAIKVPATESPWQQGDTNTYIACHRVGFPGTESHNQCLNLHSMREGDEVFLKDAEGRLYRYRVSEALTVGPSDSWATKPVEGRRMVSLQTCIEAPGDFVTLGPNWGARFIIRADQVA